MGILDFLRRKGKKEEGEEKEAPQFIRYELKQFLGRAWRTIATYDSYKTPQDIVDSLMPGRYRLDGVKPNGRFSTMWTIGVPDASGVIPSTSVPASERRVSRSESSTVSVFDVLKQITKMKDELSEMYDVLGRILGKSSSSDEDLIRRLEGLKEKYERLDSLFGGRKVEQGPVYEGKIPMWLHPQVIKTVVELPFDVIEEKLKKWGFIQEGVEQVESSGLIKIPPRPEEGEEGESEGEESGKEEE